MYLAGEGRRIGGKEYYQKKKKKGSREHAGTSTLTSVKIDTKLY